MVEYLQLVVDADLPLDRLDDLALLTFGVRLEVRLKDLRDAAFEAIAGSCLLYELLILLMPLLLFVLGLVASCRLAGAQGMTLLDLVDCTGLDFDVATLADGDVGCLVVVQVVEVVLVELLLDVIFEFDGGLKDLDEFGDVDLQVAHREGAVDVELSLSAELLGDHLLHEPMLREDAIVALLVFFESSLKPREPSPRVFKFCIGLAWLEDFLVRSQNEK